MDTRSSPQASKRQRITPQEESSGRQQEKLLQALLKKRSVKTWVESERIQDIDTGVHSDLRKLKWTLMVAPALTPKEGYSPRMLQANRLVVHVVGLHYKQSKVPQGESVQALQEGGTLLSKETMLEVKHIQVLGMLGETVLHLGTAQSCQEWIDNHGQAMADDGSPRFLPDMIDMTKRKNKWTQEQGTFSHLDTQCSICHITRGASVLFLIQLFQNFGC